MNSSLQLPTGTQPCQHFAFKFLTSRIFNRENSCCFVLLNLWECVIGTNKKLKWPSLDWLCKSTNVLTLGLVLFLSKFFIYFVFLYGHSSFSSMPLLYSMGKCLTNHNLGLMSMSKAKSETRGTRFEAHSGS